MTLVVKSPVWSDLREIGLRINQGNPDAAKEAFELLAKHPGIGRLRSFSHAGVRSWFVPGFGRYIIFYLPTKSEVQILAVLYGGRDLGSIMEERLE